MKNFIFFVIICFLPDFAIAAGDKWPVFSNKEKAKHSLYKFNKITNKFPNSFKIGNYHYTIDPITCQISFNPDDLNATNIIEYKSLEPSDSTKTNSSKIYALFENNELIENSQIIVIRSNKKKEEIEIINNIIETTYADTVPVPHTLKLKLLPVIRTDSATNPIGKKDKMKISSSPEIPSPHIIDLNQPEESNELHSKINKTKSDSNTNLHTITFVIPKKLDQAEINKKKITNSNNKKKNKKKQKSSDKNIKTKPNKKNRNNDL